ncbi:right-handed parallel beta-helix repeat-containing protein [Allonocardiopsis opalescens]|uniref:Parallel beta helix pectate lyase-like protein n=1 Tax=Allonocardiopsis opalescens TaxID=1144618 RepID=A0A2T0Q4M0_9ACTN|nr:right-handed parallel beta-helix repeat-containing protein [Allonocardiopsis opalescens]PRX98757.1 parallel beta helix pectate lyase-like protein [Allonocardiopsis opalescens]
MPSPLPPGAARRAALVLAAAALAAAGASAPAHAARTVGVDTAAELSAALADARPGDVIQLAPGRYDGAFYATASGTAAEPITLRGPRGAVLSNTARRCDPNVPADREVSYCGYGFHLNRADHWRLEGFTVADAAKGIVLDGSGGNVIDGVEVRGIGDEGVHFRAGSTGNLLTGSWVHDTGTAQPSYGEAVYIGSAESNWDRYGGTPGGPDTSDGNRIVSNRLGPGVPAEHIDIKEGTTGGSVSGNHFDGAGQTGVHFSDMWVAVKGNGYQLTDNTGVDAVNHGFRVTEQVPGWGCANVFRRNTAEVNAPGYGFHLPHHARCAPDRRNLVYSDNTVRGAGSGFANIAPVD